MRNILFSLVILFLLSGCKKDKSGQVVYNLTYSQSNDIIMKGKLNETKSAPDVDTLYTQFGDYITSITPSKLTGKFQSLRFYDENPIGEDGHILDLIDNNAPQDAPERFADFSNHATFSLKPVLWGTVGKDGLYVDKQINFIIMAFHMSYFYQEIELPVEYENINLSQFNHDYNNQRYFSDSVKTGNILHVDFFPLISPISNVIATAYFFGCTNTTSLISQEPQLIPALAPVGIMGGNFVWSNKYNAWTFDSPLEGETKTMNTTVGFISNNLVQVYAGADNLPYTSDDVIVYAPNYWERLFINVTMN